VGRARRSSAADGQSRARAEENRACAAQIRQLGLAAETDSYVAAALGQAAGYLSELAEIVGRVTSW
jgi:hypothetical protein